MTVNHKSSSIQRITGFVLLVLLQSITGCKKFVDTPLPVDSIAGSAAYVSDNSTSAVVSGILTGIYNNAAIGGTESIGYRTGMYTDELVNLQTSNLASQAFYMDNIQSVNVAQWTNLYKIIYSCNVAIEGINSTSATLYNRNQWLGETYFMRALMHYYLVNLYGDIPVVTSSDYTVNNNLSRNTSADVYKQIIADLKQAQDLLSADYKDGFSVSTTDKARPNKNAATALLARIYLYTGDWTNAETQATSLIGNSLYQMVTPANTFLKASAETIWAIAPVGTGFVKDWSMYNNNMPAAIDNTKTPASYLVYASVNPSLLGSFETGDTRVTNWLRSSTVAASSTVPATTYYFPNKYKSGVNGNEYQVVLRLAEQYLIRAEARAQQNNITGAKADLDVVRTRAGLAGTTASTKEAMIAAVIKERRTELFTEFGHRFFDLKRTGTIDAVMNVEAPKKGGTWNSQKQIWPIPASDIVANPKLTQAPGYQ